MSSRSLLDRRAMLAALPSLLFVAHWIRTSYSRFLSSLMKSIDSLGHQPDFNCDARHLAYVTRIA